MKTREYLTAYWEYVKKVLGSRYRFVGSYNENNKESTKIHHIAVMKYCFVILFKKKLQTITSNTMLWKLMLW